MMRNPTTHRTHHAPRSLRSAPSIRSSASTSVARGQPKFEPHESLAALAEPRAIVQPTRACFRKKLAGLPGMPACRQSSHAR